MNKFKAREIKGLILYRSQYGATYELSKSIKQGLESYDASYRITVDLGDAVDAKCDLMNYDFFVFGSGIYKGLISEDLGNLLINEQSVIKEKAHWAFIVCGTGNDEMQNKYKERMEQFLPGPVSVVAFRGRLKFEDLSRAHQERIRAKYIDKPFSGYDHIDHEAAKRFGRQIAKVVTQQLKGDI